VSESLIQLLTLCLLALVYLFFFRVLRAVWVEVQPPRSGRRRSRRRSQSAGQRRPPPGRLSIVLPETQRGRAYALADEVTVGRAAGCAICVDDTYASQLHARIFRREDQLLVEDLGSTNGTYLNRQRVAGPTPVRSGDHLQVGSTVFEVRP
jgi:pSer/pThr/pTyr-binding forkhead associated (FHA) protein